MQDLKQYLGSRFSWNGIIFSKNNNVKYLFCFIDVFTKYAWVEPLRYKKGKTALNAFIETVN